jgi:hypothetical protein
MSDFDWHKSSFSSGNPSSDCIEIAAVPDGGLYIRESDSPDIVLATTPARLASLLRHLDGERRVAS